MPLTIRQRIVNAVKLRMEGILTTGGYNSNLGQSVYVWRVHPRGESEADFINIKDVKRTTEQILLGRGQASHNHTLTVWVELIGKRVVDTPADDTVRAMLADIEKAVGVDRYWTEVATSTRLAEDTRPGEDQMIVEQAGQIIGGARYTFQIHYRTSAFDPYTP